MKKALILGLFLGFLLPFTTFAAFDTNLKYGDKSSQVTEWQELMAADGVYTGPITGKFLALTLKATKAFQAKYNISPISGFVGPLTRAKANDVLDLASSDIDEQSSTGTVNQPVVSTDFTQLMTLLTALKAQEEQQTQVQQQIVTNTLPASPSQVPQNLSNIIISNVSTTKVNQPYSVGENIAWSTSIPTNGKVKYWNSIDIQKHLLDSMSGLSTGHYLIIPNIQYGIQYFYEIESIGADGISVAKYNDTFSNFDPALNPPAPVTVTPVIVPTLTVTSSTLSNVQLNSVKQKIGAYTLQAGNSENLRISNLAIGVTGYSNISNMYITYGPSDTPSVAVNPQMMNNFSVNFITIPAGETWNVNVFADTGNTPSSLNTTLLPTAIGISSNALSNNSSTTGQTINIE